LSKSRISNYEQGIRRPGLEESRELAEALGTVSATYLLCLDNGGFLTEEELRLVTLFRATDARGRATILDVARLVVSLGGDRP
jgi:transcriptional regulator with XRE-family HTH domain